MVERETYNQALADRVQLAALNVAFDESVMGPLVAKTVDNLYQQQVESIVRNDSSFFTDRLASLRSGLESRGVRSSKPLLLANFISSNIGEYLLVKAINARSRSDNGSFMLFFDLRQGIATVCDTFKYVEDEISGDSDDSVSTAFSDLKDRYESIGIGTPEANQAEAFIKFRALLKELAELLKRDPSGFSMADFIVEGMQKESRRGYMPDFTIDEVVRAGGALAAKTYKALYPLLEAKPESA